MAGVSSVEPSSTTTHRAGGTDCAATLSSVRRMYSASSRHGETSRYLRPAPSGVPFPRMAVNLADALR